MAQAAVGTNVVPDLALRTCLNDTYLDQDDAAAITAAQLTALRGDVFCDDDDIASIAGVEYLTGVTTLSLAGTSVSDLSALRGLTKLEDLYLYDTAVSNVSALAGLVNLQNLYLTGTRVSDISALRNLSRLETLDLVDTNVVDLSALRGLSRLEWLDLSGTSVSDISPLRGLPSLEWLGLLGTLVSDISAVPSLPSLEWLDLSGTQVADVSVLRNLANLQGLDLSYTRVTDVSPLANARNLSDLDLSNAKVADISTLSRLPAVAGFCVDGADDPDGSCWEFSATGQDVTLPNATVGTYRMPISGASGDPVTVKVTSGPATVNNSAGTITYTGAGTVKLSWQSRAAAADSTGEAGFSGTARATVTSPATAAFAKVGTPKVSGTAKVGGTLSVSSVGAWSPAPTSATYQWYRSGAAISGATRSSYQLVAADRGKKITVRVTGQRAGYKAAGSPASAAVTVGYGTLASSRPTIAGNRVVGAVLTVVVGAWTPGVAFSYQWYADGKKVNGATRASYALATSMSGKKITVTVTGKLAGYTTKSVTSAATVKVTKIG